MKLKVEKIDEDKFERIFVFGDLHGSLHLFDEMIAKISPSKNDLIIILGDSCDRGNNSIGLYMRYLEMINQGYNIKHIMGNHEYMFLNGYLLNGGMYDMLWVRNGGEKVLDEIENKNLSPKDLTWLKDYILKMPHIISSKSYIFTHAYFNPRVKAERQSVDVVMWQRDAFWLFNDTGKEIFYGHTPSRDNKISFKPNGCYGMDVGAVFFDNLCIMEAKSKEIFDLGRKI